MAGTAKYLVTVFCVCAVLISRKVNCDSTGRSRSRFTPTSLRGKFGARTPACDKNCTKNAAAPSCKTLAGLGESCTTGSTETVQCGTPFSICQNNRCQCLSGFSRQDDRCAPNKVSCPGQTPSASPRHCTVSMVDCKTFHCSFEKCPTGFTGNSNEGINAMSGRVTSKGLSCMPTTSEGTGFKAASDEIQAVAHSARHVLPPQSSVTVASCPAGHFCNIYAAYEHSECHVEAYGYCCPNSCPVGEPHARASCEWGAETPCEDQPGYACHRNFLNEHALRVFGRKIDKAFLATCCPSQCPAGMVAVDSGSCVYEAKAGQKCVADGQCPYTFFCIDGVCQCDEARGYSMRRVNRRWRCSKSGKVDLNC